MSDKPRPGGFMRERQIGHIAGEPVIGLVDYDEVAGVAHRCEVVVTMSGLRLACDGANLAVGSYTGDGLPLADLARLVELWQAGVIDQLVKIARRWRDEG